MADWSRPTIEAQKVYLAGGAAVLALAWDRIPKGWRHNLLLVLSVVCCLNFYGGTEKLQLKIDNYDLIHYYLTTRYFDELGYYDLYPAALLVDYEHGPYRKLKQCRVQDDEEGYRLVPVRTCIERGREVREQKFTPERWAAFEHDFLYVQRKTGMNKKMWQIMVKDRGFNATPVWIMLAKPFAMAPPESIKWICYLDIILLASALIGVAYAYSRETAYWCLLFLGVTYSLRWPIPSLVFLRYFWISALLWAMVLIKWGRGEAGEGGRLHFLGGALAGLSALLRFFPAVWMWGPFAKGVAGLFDRSKPFKERVNRRLLMMAGGFLAAVLVLEGGALATLGTQPAKDHIENIREHTKPEELSSRRVGFALGYAYKGELEPKWITDERKQEVADQKNTVRFLGILLTLALGWALRKRSDDEAFAYGLIPFFLLTTASYYYFVARITLIAIHASDLGKWRNKVGLAILLLLEVFSNWAQVNHVDYRVYLVGRLAWGLTAYSVLMIGWMFWEEYGPQKPVSKSIEAEPPSDDEPPQKKKQKQKKKKKKKKTVNSEPAHSEGGSAEEPGSSEARAADP